MKLIVTGGCGFLGSNLAADALQRGDELFVFDNLSRLGSASNLTWLKQQGEFRFLQGDIRDSESVSKAVAEFKPDALFHLAGQVAMTTSISNPRMDFEVNALGTLNVLEAVRVHARDAAVIYSSTNKVYGDLSQFSYRETPYRYECLERPIGFDESTPLSFASPYGCSKGAADQYMLDYARVFDLNTVVFRHSSMYGGRQFATFDQGWLGWFCQKALEHNSHDRTQEIQISGTGKQVRDVLHADDMRLLYRAALSNIKVAAGNAFNIGGGSQNSLSIVELFLMLEELTERPVKYSSGPARISDQKVFIADIARAHQLLHWVPTIGAREGVLKMLDWVRSQQ